MSVIVAGGGIAGLSFALTCHEIGVPVTVYESAAELKPLGVGINLQPNAVRELFQLGLEAPLRRLGVEAEEWALYYYGAYPVWSEPRGSKAGYRWPQFSVHRGQFQLLLLDAVRKRLGAKSIVADARLSHYETTAAGVQAHFTRADGSHFSDTADLLIGADGIHSQVRKQMHPDQGEVNWSGAVMWRGVSRCKPPQGKNAFVMVGSLAQRFISYPIEPPDANGNTLLNWIAELKPDNSSAVNQSDWNKPATADAFMAAFSDWSFGFLNVADVVDRAQGIWEFPMVDRDPVDHWVDGRTVLIGDAAHAMFPHGSTGASQAIVDGRVLGAQIKAHGLTQTALKHYETELLESVNELVLRNRGEGPIGVLVDIEAQLAEGKPLEDAINPEQVAAFMARYKEAAGFARDTLNAAAPIIGS